MSGVGRSSAPCLLERRARLIAHEFAGRTCFVIAIALTVLFVGVGRIDAAEITVWTARSIGTVLAEIGPELERLTEHKLTITSDLASTFERRAKAGEPFDVLITGSVPLAGLVEMGEIVAGTQTPIARSGIGVEVRAGAPKPDISSPDAFKRALLGAKSIAYLKDVGSGIHVARVIEGLGIAETVASKVTRPESDIVSELVASGEIELGIVVITQILTTPGVELVGPLPAALQSHVDFAAGVSTRSRAPRAARDLITFLSGPMAAPVIKAQGMEPASGESK